MLTFIFIILMIMVFGKLLIWSIKAAWGITKILFTVVFLPIILITLALSGAIYIAIVWCIISSLCLKIIFFSVLFIKIVNGNNIAVNTQFEFVLVIAEMIVIKMEYTKFDTKIMFFITILRLNNTWVSSEISIPFSNPNKSLKIWPNDIFFNFFKMPPHFTTYYSIFLC